MKIEQLKKDPSLLEDFISFFFDFSLYPYQKTFINSCFANTRIAGKWCRQSGKSQVVSIYVLLRAILDKTAVVIVSPTQNQSNEMYKKIQVLIDSNPEIKAIVRKETQQEMTFANGSRIISLPSGFEGRTIRGYTCDILVIEEAGIMEDTVVNTVLVPMLASKGISGQIIKIGTPLTRNHFYRSCFKDSLYKVINVTWEDCVKVGQYSREFIDEQKAGLTDIEFRTEYESEFIDSGHMFFPAELLEQASATYTLLPRL